MKKVANSLEFATFFYFYFGRLYFTRSMNGAFVYFRLIINRPSRSPKAKSLELDDGLKGLILIVIISAKVSDPFFF